MTNDVEIMHAQAYAKLTPEQRDVYVQDMMMFGRCVLHIDHSGRVSVIAPAEFDADLAAGELEPVKEGNMHRGFDEPRSRFWLRIVGNLAVYAVLCAALALLAFVFVEGVRAGGVW